MIEAIVERPDAKRALYAQLESLMDADAILASNTSNLDIFPLVPPGLQNRAIIAHWYTPPYLCDLVDLCPGAHTDPAAIATVRDMVRAMGKVPVVFKQMVQGYVANRLQATMGLEVQRMLDEGLVTPKDIDDSVIHGIALRMPILGIMAKADFTGLQLMQQGMAQPQLHAARGARPQRHARQTHRRGPHRRDVGKRLFRLGQSHSRRTVPRTRPQAARAETCAARDQTDGGNMISYDLAGKTALVTGGASGIGFATARMLAKFGATVAVNFLADDPRGPEAVEKLIAEGGKAIGAPGSVGEQGDRRAHGAEGDRAISGGSICW